MLSIYFFHDFSNFGDTEGQNWHEFVDGNEDHLLTPSNTRDEKIRLYDLLVSCNRKFNFQKRNK